MTRTSALAYAKRLATEKGLKLSRGQKLYKNAQGKAIKCEVVYGLEEEDYDIIVARPIPHKRDYVVSEYVNGVFTEWLGV